MSRVGEKMSITISDVDMETMVIVNERGGIDR